MNPMELYSSILIQTFPIVSVLEYGRRSTRDVTHVRLRAQICIVFPLAEFPQPFRPIHSKHLSLIDSTASVTLRVPPLI